MLVKLLPDQVASYWEVIWPAIEGALPPTASEDGGERKNWILSRLLSDRMQCWALIERSKDGDQIIYGIGTTTITEEMCSGARDVLLYSVYAFPGLRKDHLIDAFSAISKWAKSQGCKRLVGYSSNPEWMKTAEKFGTTFTTYGSLSLNFD